MLDSESVSPADLGWARLLWTRSALEGFSQTSALCWGGKAALPISAGPRHICGASRLSAGVRGAG